MQRFLPFLGNRRFRVVGLVFVSVTAALCESVLLAVVAKVATTLVNKGANVPIRLGPIYVHKSVSDWLLLGLAAAVLRIALQFPLTYLIAVIAADFEADLRKRLFTAFTRASWSVQSRDAGGQFQELATNHVFQATQGALYATSLLASLLMLGVLVVSALVVSPLVASVVMAAVLVLMALLRPFNSIGSRHARGLSVAQLDFASGVHEAISIAEESHVFGAEQAQQARLDRLVNVARRGVLVTQFLGRMIPGAFQCTVLLLVVAGLGVVYLFGLGHLAAIGAVVLLLLRASTYGQALQGAYHLLHQHLPFLERLTAAEQRYLDSTVSYGQRTLDNTPSIAFHNVSYGYLPGLPVLHEVSFEIAPGEVVGLIGPSGAGKSTLVQLFLGLRSPDGGDYLLEGVRADTLSRSSWTKAFAAVPQDPHLLHASVSENIRFFRDLTDAAVVRAARLAGIHDEIACLPSGYETVIGQRADAVSGGQRQRICLARALANDPYVLVLDEPTSALDPHSEALIRESLDALRGHTTLLVVAHRMSTLSICDRVMVFVDGRLEAFGPAEELARSNRYYQNASTLARSGLLLPP